MAQSQRALLTLKYYPLLIIFYAVLSGLLLGFLWDTEEFTGEWHEPISDNLWWIWPLCSLVLWPLYTYVGVKVLEIMITRIYLFPSQLHVVRRTLNEKLKCCLYCFPGRRNKRKRSISQSSNLKLKRHNLAVRTQQVVEELTKDDPVWQEDPIIPPAQLEEQREKEADALFQHLKRNESLDPATIEAFVQQNLTEDMV